MKTNLIKVLTVMIILIVPFSIQAQSDNFEITTTTGSTITISTGDKIKFAKLIEEKPSLKHTGLLGTMYSLHLDNGRFDDMGVLSYTEITGTDQDVYLNHSEIRYNLVVSVEWDAKQEYLSSITNCFKQISNLLYDITDGQARLDTIMIYDNQEHWLEADIRIWAHNMVHPNSALNGIGSIAIGDVINLPRKWFGDANLSRNESYDETPPLDYNSSDNIAIIAHELGHYLFGFDEEYEFTDALGRCSSVLNYGFMDDSYFSGMIVSALATEMSSSITYQYSECTNTKQFQRNGASCWEVFEGEFEGLHGTENIYMPIYRPTILDISENVVPSGLTYMPGPNSDLTNLDYDVGSRLITPVTPTMSSAFDLDVVTHDWQLNRLSGIEVVLRKYNGISYRDVEQGYTSDVDPFGLSGGGIYVLGAETGDQIMTSADYTIMGISTKAGGQSSSLTNDWYSGVLTISDIGDSLDIQLNKVEGNYPLVVKGSKENNNTVIDLTYFQAFTENPTLIIPETGNQYILSPIGNSNYTVSISDTLNTFGQMTINAKDALNSDFFFNLNYESIRLESNSTSSKETIDGLIRVENFDTTSQEIFIVSSPYPVLESNLPMTSIKISRSYSIWKETTDSVQITFRYNDKDLYSHDEFVGLEDMIELYMWDSTSMIWVPVISTVDTSINTVTAMISENGVFALFSSDVVTDVNDMDELILPNEYKLFQNYPNPFNPSTDIMFSLPTRTYVKIEIFNLLGQKVKTIGEGEYSAGTHTVTWDGRESASGVYFYKLEAKEFINTKKMLLLK